MADDNFLDRAKERILIIKQWMEISLKQFQQQQAMNERLYSKLENIEKLLKK